MSKFSPSYKGIGELLCAPFMVEEMKRRAENVKAAAEAAAPDATPVGVGYKYQFRIESGIREDGSRRAFGRVVNDSDYAVFVEFGGRNTPKHRTLGKALDAAKE